MTQKVKEALALLEKEDIIERVPENEGTLGHPQLSWLLKKTKESESV